MLGSGLLGLHLTFYHFFFATFERYLKFNLNHIIGLVSQLNPFRATQNDRHK